MNKSGSKKISLLAAMSIGIGGMVGGGIFAVLGLATDLARGGTPLSFFIAGVIALVTAYSYSKLSMKLPDRGGTVKFINTGFGTNVFSGGMNNLLWLSYIVMLSLYASAFGSYAPNLINISGDVVQDGHIYSSGVVLIAAIVNYYSIKVVGKIEVIAFAIKLIILLAFVILGLYGLFSSTHMEQLNVSNWEAPINLLVAGMIIFVAYEGFELIANASPDMENPGKNIPRAYFLSVALVMILYIVIAIITVGSLAFEEIASAKDYVLAEAAKPLLGHQGFTIMTIAALISTFSAINASLYGGSRVSYELSVDDELPHQLSHKFWNKPVGLMITIISTLILTNTLELESISTAGSVGFLLIFAVVNYVCFKLRKKLGIYPLITILGCLFCALALGALITKQLVSDRKAVYISLGIVAVCFLFEYIYKAREKAAQK